MNKCPKCKGKLHEQVNKYPSQVVNGKAKEVKWVWCENCAYEKEEDLN